MDSSPVKVSSALLVANSGIMFFMLSSVIRRCMLTFRSYRTFPVFIDDKEGAAAGACARAVCVAAVAIRAERTHVAREAGKGRDRGLRRARNTEGVLYVGDGPNE